MESKNLDSRAGQAERTGHPTTTGIMPKYILLVQLEMKVRKRCSHQPDYPGAFPKVIPGSVLIFWTHEGAQLPFMGL